MGELKHCSCCNKELPLKSFPFNKKEPDGHSNLCKECSAQKREKEEKEFKELLDKGYQVCTRCGRTLPLEAFSRKKSTEEKRIRRCKECVTATSYEYWAKYRAARREANASYAREYRKEHKEQDREWRKKYTKRRKETDELFKFKTSIMNSMNKIFRRNPKQRSVKDCRMAKIIGLSGKEFCEYLLKTFSDRYGREWDGVEKVHIDHIVPLVTAKTEEDVIKLNHYTNLQLLTPEDNMAKGEQIDWVKPKEDKA